MKRIISVILSLAIGITMFTFSASAADYSIKVKRSYKSGYTYVTLVPTTGTVYYTTDGTKADKDDKKYTEKLKITKPTKLRMTVYKNGKAVKSYSAEIAVRTKTPSVTVKEAGENQYTFTFTVADGADIYYTTNGKTPSEKNGKKLDESGSITVDAGTTVKAIAVKDGWKNSKVKTETAPEAEKTQEQEYIDEVLELINKERRAAGLTAFTTTDKLTEAAAVRAEELTEKFDHMRPDGRSWSTVFSDFGISGATGENVAAGQATPEAVVKAWMNSQGHRENILSTRSSKIGIGYYKTDSDYRHYWVQIFAR